MVSERVIKRFLKIVGEEAMKMLLYSRRIATLDLRTLETLVTRFEQKALKALVGTLADPDLQRTIYADRARSLAAKKVRERTKPWEDAIGRILRANPNADTKTIIRLLEADQSLFEANGTYFFVDTGIPNPGIAIKATTLKSKISRIRKSLRIT